jgi:hypothetical protein
MPMVNMDWAFPALGLDGLKPHFNATMNLQNQP